MNVDTTTEDGILRAKHLALIPSGKADLIFSGSVRFAMEHLYDPVHKGRIIGLFRNPVERWVSRFYYLQMATWEKGYNPIWKDITIIEYAQTAIKSGNLLISEITGVRLNNITDEHLQLAKQIVKEYFIVGLTNQMEESIYRFNNVMGITPEESKACMDEFFRGVSDDATTAKTNSNPHPVIDKNHPAWQIIAQKMPLDIQLYDYIHELFHGEQKHVVDMYV